MNTSEFTPAMYSDVLKRIEHCNDADKLRRMLIEAIENADIEGSAGLAEYIGSYWLSK